MVKLDPVPDVGPPSDGDGRGIVLLGGVGAGLMVSITGMFKPNIGDAFDSISSSCLPLCILTSDQS